MMRFAGYTLMLAMGFCLTGCITINLYECKNLKDRAEKGPIQKSTGVSETFETDIRVDAGERPTGSDIEVFPGDRITFDASGTWQWGWSDRSGPAGTPGRPHADELPVQLNGENIGTLLGRIGESRWFAIGDHKEMVVPNDAEGLLEFIMNDRPGSYDDNAGKLELHINVERP